MAKKSIFSGLNNLEVNTILRYNFNDKFGFTENEVMNLVNYYNDMENIEDIKIELEELIVGSNSRCYWIKKYLYYRKFKCYLI